MDGIDVLLGASQQPQTGLDVLMSGGSPGHQDRPPPSQAHVNPVLGGANAVATGYWRGLARFAGLPVDAAANVIDLGKAALATPWVLAGKVPPEALQLKDRADVVGSGDNLIRAAQSVGVGRALVNPADPSFEGGYLQAAGGALAGVQNPRSYFELANQLANNVGGSLAGKAVFDATGSDALAIAAGMSPQIAQQVATMTAKSAIRGGESGRQEMEKRISDLRNAGIENPTMGLASGNKPLGAFENILQSTPGAINAIDASRSAAIEGMRRVLSGAAETASPSRGADVAGGAIKSGLAEFRDRFNVGQRDVYGKLDQHISQNTPVVVNNTKDALTALTQGIDGAPNIGQRFINGKINSLRGDFELDTGLTRPDGTRSATVSFGPQGSQPQPVTRTSQVSWGSPKWAPRAGGEGATKAAPYSPSGSVSRTIQIGKDGQYQPSGEVTRVTSLAGPTPGEGKWKPPANPVLPYQAVKQLRSQIGEELSNTTLVPDVPNSQWKRLYSGLSSDMQAAAIAAGPDASQAWSRANAYNRAGMERLERVAPFANAAAPEQAFTSLMNTTRENNTTLQAVKKSLPEGARGVIAGTVIDRLGRANPGNQNELGDAFSTERFLTNWNTMTPKARNELFSGFDGSTQVKRDVDAVARAASMMRENSKLWANPSGTGANAAARLLMGGGLLAGGLSPWAPAAVGGFMGANRMAAGLLTNKDVVDSVARKTTVDPRLTASQARALIGSGLLTTEAQR